MYGPIETEQNFDSLYRVCDVETRDLNKGSAVGIPQLCSIEFACCERSKPFFSSAQLNRSSIDSSICNQTSLSPFLFDSASLLGCVKTRGQWPYRLAS